MAWALALVAAPAPASAELVGAVPTASEDVTCAAGDTATASTSFAGGYPGGLVRVLNTGTGSAVQWLDVGRAVAAGDESWGRAGPLGAGGQASQQVACGAGGGAARVEWYAGEPTPPLTYTGQLHVGGSTLLPFRLLHAQEYSAVVTPTGGGLDVRVSPSDVRHVTSATALDLGTLVPPTGLSQPQLDLTGTDADGTYVVTLEPRAVEVGNLVVTPTAAPAGATVTARFDLAGDATVAAAVTDLAGAPVRELTPGTAFQRGQDRELTWDGRRADGSSAADGVYAVAVTATDGYANVRTQTAQVRIDSTPPSIVALQQTVSPAGGPLRVTVFDTGSGVVAASLTVGGATAPAATRSGPGDLVATLPAGSLGRSVTVTVEARDAAGNINRLPVVVTYVAPPGPPAPTGAGGVILPPVSPRASLIRMAALRNGRFQVASFGGVGGAARYPAWRRAFGNPTGCARSDHGRRLRLHFTRITLLLRRPGSGAVRCRSPRTSLVPVMAWTEDGRFGTDARLRIGYAVDEQTLRALYPAARAAGQGRWTLTTDARGRPTLQVVTRRPGLTPVRLVARYYP